MSNELGRTIKESRLIMGMSQTDLARNTGVDTKTISLIERGIRIKPNIDTLLKLADVLNIVDIRILHLAGYTQKEVSELLFDIKEQDYEYSFKFAIKGHGKLSAENLEEAKILIEDDLHRFLSIKNIKNENLEVVCDDCNVDITIKQEI